MYLKILPFNKTLFKKDFNMVKILAFAMAAILFISITAYVLSRPNSLNNLEKYFAEEGIEYNRDDMIQGYKDEIKWKLTDEEASIFLLILVPISLVAILFGEEKRMKTFEVLSVMPYTRYEIFFNKLLAALLAIILPFIINGLIMILALGISSNLRIFYSVKHILVWMLSNIYYQLPILSFSLIFGIITGTTISQLILTVIFLIFPIGFPLLITFNLEYWGIHWLGDWIGKFRIRSFLDKILMGYSILGVFDSHNYGIEHYIYYIILSIILIIISKILFDKIKLERSGETLEFEKTEGFFKLGVSVCTALLMALILVWFSDGFIYDSFSSRALILVIGYIIGGALGYFVAKFSIKFNRSKA